MVKYDKHWIAGLNPQEKKNIESLLGTNNLVLDKLIKICYNMDKNSELGDNDFETPNWALRQAHWLGFRKALKQIIMLCTITDDQSP